MHMLDGELATCIYLIYVEVRSTSPIAERTVGSCLNQ